MRAMLPSLAVAVWLLGAMQLHADPVVESVQQTLKDQGFYFGGITGTKDADTAAAIRRYQIRNGLQVTGELNAETRKSLGVAGRSPAPRATPSTPASPRVPPPQSSGLNNSDLRDDSPALEDQREDLRARRFQPDPMPARDALFDGTPYEGASFEEQQRVIIGAQSLLARRGYYRGELDGVFGPGTQFALRAYQACFGLVTTGLLDKKTLASLGLLPGQQAPGITAPRRHFYRRVPTIFAPNGERIYIPR